MLPFSSLLSIPRPRAVLGRSRARFPRPRVFWSPAKPWALAGWRQGALHTKASRKNARNLSREKTWHGWRPPLDFAQMAAARLGTTDCGRPATAPRASQLVASPSRWQRGRPWRHSLAGVAVTSLAQHSLAGWCGRRLRLSCRSVSGASDPAVWTEWQQVSLPVHCGSITSPNRAVRLDRVTSRSMATTLPKSFATNHTVCGRGRRKRNPAANMTDVLTPLERPLAV